MAARIPPLKPKRFDSQGREIPRLDELPESDGIPMEDYFHIQQSGY